MEIKIIEDRLKKYKPTTQQEEDLALREIAQAIALCGLAKTDFFKHASFIGGSCLRIIHSLQRFSEDLDFWTLRPNPNFAWQPYLRAVQEEFRHYAFDLIIEDRTNAEAKIKRGFLKEESIGKVLILTRTFKANKKLSIKFEIDTRPPPGAYFETRSMEFPYAFTLTVLDQPSLFASKMAALFDHEKEVKGRHWYDFVWYVSRQWPLNHSLLKSCLLKNIQEPAFPWLLQQLTRIIESTDWKSFRDDVFPLISPEEQKILKSWDKEFLLRCVEGLEYLRPKPISLSALIVDGRGKPLIEQVKTALEAGASVNDDTRNGHRPLQLALTNGHAEIARLLIEHGADINCRDRSGQTPLQAAVNHGQFENAKLLIKKGVPFNPAAPNLEFIYAKLYEFLRP